MEEYTFIANSGIQLYLSHMKIDFSSSSRHLFHEWFDPENVEYSLEIAFQLPESKKIVLLSDLERLRFITEDGRLTSSEEQILAVPDLHIIYDCGDNDIEELKDLFALKLSDRRCHIDKLLNQWLPLPVFELDLTGKFKQGPYNWCRCKIIPKGEITDGKIDSDVLLAFDTRALYHENTSGNNAPEYAECPVFDSPTEKSKKFRLCDRISNLMDYCAGSNQWIREYLMWLVHGVSKLDNISINPMDNDYRYAFLATYFLLVEYLQTHLNLPTFELYRERGVQSANVEMAIDIGNSSTAAVLFDNSNFTRVKPLQLQNFSIPIKDSELNKSEEPFNMRVAFKKVTFGDKTLEGSRQFIWPGLVRLGVEAEYLTHMATNIAEGDEVLSTYSSPKRYLWDYSPRPQEWRCVRGAHGEQTDLPKIVGINDYFKDDGSLDKEGQGYGLHYSRRSLMTLAFIEILAQARVQVNSHEYRVFNGQITNPRHINRIILTCPAAMSHQEQQSLRDCLSEALFVLEKFGQASASSVKIIPDPKTTATETPQWMYDEATCSQFVYLYGRFNDVYKNNTIDFFNIYGKPRKNAQGIDTPSVVVGSVDIGAGTSDIMLCRYDYNIGNPSRLAPFPIFWDSFAYAGDDMMQMLILNVLLQGDNGILEKELLSRGLSQREARAKLYNFYGGNHNNLSFQDRLIRRDFNLQVLVPIIYHFLSLLEHGITYCEIVYSDVFKDTAPNNDVLSHFKGAFGFDLQEVRWIYDKDVISRQIEASMNQLIEVIATIMYAHDCDIVLLTGRPTSLRPIQDIFLKYFSVDPNRLIVLNKHRIGRWYPFADEHGFVINSKSIVAVGAMIGYLASSTGRLPFFSLDLSNLSQQIKSTADYLLVRNDSVSQNVPFITPASSVGSITANSFPLYIGCRQYDSHIYPVRPFLVLDINKNAISERLRKQNPGLEDGEIIARTNDYCDNLIANLPIKFTLDRPNYGSNKEVLEIVNVTNSLGDNLQVRDFSLIVQSLNDPDCYWLDSGAFNINISYN